MGQCGQNFYGMMVQLAYHDGTVTVPSWFLICSVGKGLSGFKDLRIIRFAGILRPYNVVVFREEIGRASCRERV